MIEILPRRVPETPFWHNILFYLSLALLAAVVLGYLVLFNFESKYIIDLQEVEIEVEERGSQEEKIMEKEVSIKQQKIKDFSKVFLLHQKVSGFFDFLEKITHPQVWFSELDLNSESYGVSLSGHAPSFQTLGQQVFIFKSQNLIKEVNLSELSLGEDGGVDFTFLLTLGGFSIK